MRRAFALACVLALSLTWPEGALAPVWVPLQVMAEASGTTIVSSTRVVEGAPRVCGSVNDLGILVPLPTRPSFPLGEPAEIAVFLHNPGPLETGLGGMGPVVPGFLVHSLPDLAPVARVRGGSGAYPAEYLRLPVGSTALLAVIVVDIGPDARGPHLVTFETMGFCAAAAVAWA